MAVGLTYAEGLTSICNTYFVYEDGSWRHRFSQEEYDLFMPDASYEEFVRAQKDLREGYPKPRHYHREHLVQVLHGRSPRSWQSLQG